MDYLNPMKQERLKKHYDNWPKVKLVRLVDIFQKWKLDEKWKVDLDIVLEFMNSMNCPIYFISVFNVLFDKITFYKLSKI